MAGILISTIYEKSDSTKLSIRDFNVKKIFLLIDKETNSKQLESINLIKKLFNKTLDIIEKKIDLYDINSISLSVINIIDSIEQDSEIYVDISQGRKTQAFAVLMACYARSDRIKNIVYWGPDNKMTIMPKLKFDIKPKSKNILNKINNYNSITGLSKDLKLSRAQLYRNIKRLEDSCLIAKENGKFVLTTAGKIAMR